MKEGWLDDRAHRAARSEHRSGGFDNWLIWWSGRSMALARAVDDPFDRNKLRQIGTGVIVSSLAAASSCAVSSLWLTGGLSVKMRVATIVLAAAVGATLVATFDRPTLIAADVSSRPARARWLRWPLILTMGLLAALKTTTFFLPADLDAAAAAERQGRAVARLKELNGAFGLNALETARAEAVNAVAARQEAVATPPPAVTEALKAASRCNRAVGERRRSLKAGGVSTFEARRRTAAWSRSCESARRAAVEARNVYRVTAQAELDRARNREESRTEALELAERGAHRLRSSGDTADAKVTGDSVTAIWSLVRYNPVALVYIVAFWGLWVMADGLGLLVGSIVGRTSNGRDREVSDEVATVGAKQSLLRLRARTTEAGVVSAALAEGLQSDQARQAYTSAASHYAQRIAPVTAGAAAIEDLVDGVMRMVSARAALDGVTPEASETVDSLLKDALNSICLDARKES